VWAHFHFYITVSVTEIRNWKSEIGETEKLRLTAETQSSGAEKAELENRKSADFAQNGGFLQVNRMLSLTKNIRVGALAFLFSIFCFLFPGFSHHQ
jgi:hypothetical protein